MAANVTELRRLINKPIESEGDVVHLLVEVRKIIETMEGRFPVLEFFCDWPLHSVLDRRKARKILQTFDKLVVESRMAGGVDSKNLMRTVQPLISASSGEFVGDLGPNERTDVRRGPY